MATSRGGNAQLAAELPALEVVAGERDAAAQCTAMGSCGGHVTPIGHQSGSRSMSDFAAFAALGFH